MNKLLKKILFVFIITFIFFSSYIMCFSTNDKVYKNREVHLNGLDSIFFIFHDEMYFDGENSQVSTEQKAINNYLIIGVSFVLVMYWIILLLIFEKEDSNDFTYENIDDFTTLNKYNPLIAGCLADNRQVLPRDILAVILNLIKKDYIKMEMIPNTNNDKENYTYTISKNREKVGGLDKIETYILNWIFSFYEETKVNLIKKFKELPKRKDFLKKLTQLNNIAEDEMYKIGANIPKVPKELRIFNVFLAIFVFSLSVVHIIINGVSIQIYQSTIWILLLVTGCCLLLIPIIAIFIHLILFLITLIKKLIKSTTDRFSGKNLVQMSALILIFMFLIIALLYCFIPNKYICLDIFMIGMSILIVRTDNLMTKHNKEILNDYYALNEIKYRIEEYSLIKDEQINYMKIWDEYLIYAVAFGIPIPIVNKLNSSYKEDEDISYLLKCENLYYICKAYLEVMWDMNFKKGTNIFNIDNVFKIDDDNQLNNYHKF